MVLEREGLERERSKAPLVSLLLFIEEEEEEGELEVALLSRVFLQNLRLMLLSP